MGLEPAKLGARSAPLTGSLEPAGSTALTASGRRAGRTLRLPRPAPRAAPRLWIRQPPRLEVAVVVVVQLLLLLSFTDLVTTALVHGQPAAIQGQNPGQITCFPGQYLAKDGTCKPCIHGKGYTIQHNMEECTQCSICPEDTHQNSSCTPTRDTVCLCKAGTFRGKDSPEFCQNCTECTNKEMEASPCTPWSDRQCISNESNTNVTEDSLAPEKPNVIYHIVALVLALVLVFCLIACILCPKTQRCKRIPLFKKCTCAGHEQEDPRDLLNSTLQSLETDPQVLEPAEAERCPTRRNSSDGKDPGCVSLLWQRSLKVDDPQVVRSQAQDTGGSISQKLLKCLNKTWHYASVNAQQHGLDELGESDARNTTEKDMG